MLPTVETAEVISNIHTVIFPNGNIMLAMRVGTSRSPHLNDYKKHSEVCKTNTIISIPNTSEPLTHLASVVAKSPPREYP